MSQCYFDDIETQFFPSPPPTALIDDDCVFVGVEQGEPSTVLKREKRPRSPSVELLCSSVWSSDPADDTLPFIRGYAGSASVADGDLSLAGAGNTTPASPSAAPASCDEVIAVFRSREKEGDTVFKGDPKNKKKTKIKRTKEVLSTVPPAKYWCFTAYPQQGKSAEEWGDYVFNGIKLRCKRVAMQIERCPETDRLHIQGCLEATSKLRWSEFKLDRSIHWEKCNGTWNDNFAYCTKEDTRAGRTWLKGCYVSAAIRTIAEEDMMPWQTNLLTIMRGEPDDRTVHWIYSTVGRVGKSSFAKFCCVHEPGVMVANGKATDILSQIVQYKDANGSFPRTIIMNLPRSTEGHVSYTALEQMKDGLAMSSKYEGGQIVMNPCHVFVFANTGPETFKMSEDRFRTLCLDDILDEE